MPKVSVYLPDELYARARERDLKLSALTQAAVEQALRRHANDAWIEAVSSRPPRYDLAVDTEALLAGVREEFGT